MSIGPEEFGMAKEEQLEIRSLAILGAIRDKLGPTKPNLSQSESDQAKANVEEAVARIMQEFGVEDTEARLILAEHIILSKHEGE